MIVKMDFSELDRAITALLGIMTMVSKKTRQQYLNTLRSRMKDMIINELTGLGVV